MKFSLLIFTPYKDKILMLIAKFFVVIKKCIITANCTLCILHLEGNNLTGKGAFTLSEVAAAKYLV